MIYLTRLIEPLCILNPNLIEFSRKIPHNLKIKNSETKWILKQVLKRYLPKEYVDRPKMGFSVPIDLWLQTTLNKWAKDILNVNSIKKQGILNPILVEKIFTQHSSRKKNYGTLLWRLIILQNWLKKSYDI